MPAHRYTKGQNLNDYVEMLHAIYGPGQNYSKSRSEIFQHLAEVCGIAGKHMFKKQNMEAASRFIPKIFGWACALVSAVNPANTTLEEMILRKFPQACPYCVKRPCECWSGEKPDMQEDTLSALYFKRSSQQARSINDFELMFNDIYSHSWKGKDGRSQPLAYIYLRMIEELAEVSEALRFHHIYPKNFENEIADFLGWWFALAISLRAVRGDDSKLTDDLLWDSYPGHCVDCDSVPCFCQQGPVRELMSKPAPGSFRETDGLTGLRNQTSYEDDIKDLANGDMIVAKPIACVRIDVDKFKLVNDTYGHAAGNAALKHIAAIIRQKARIRDRIYRISGDEFGILMPDASEEEAYGGMRRIVSALADSPVLWTDPDGNQVTFTVSVSVGVSECSKEEEVPATFEAADAASFVSKDKGRAQVSRASASVPQLDNGAS